ncbi:MAG: hypothetical protein IIU99_03095 [Treponema sp.]|nr:hypothetical protein [Treponema sp.]
MKNFLELSFNDINNLKISPKDCVKWATEILQDKDKCVLPEKNSIKFGDNCFFNTMPSYIPFLNRFGVKVVSRIPNRIPALKGDILLYDSVSGELISFLDGTWITTIRTGAVAAITIDKLKSSEAKNISFIGLGNTARATLLCFNEINKYNDINVNILAYKDQHIDFMNRFVQYKNINFTIYNSIDELIQTSDIIVSCVTSMDTVFADEKLYKKGVLVVPVHTRGFQNCDLYFDKIFCDDIGHVSGFKYFKEYKSITEMSEILTGKTLGRTSNEERILAYNIGISIQDVYFASKIYDISSNFYTNNLNKFWV